MVSGFYAGAVFLSAQRLEAAPDRLQSFPRREVRDAVLRKIPRGLAFRHAQDRENQMLHSDFAKKV